MKLDILMKLIALANNNPNDNEANLAARKACKAIIEYKFVITGGTPPKQNTTPPPNNPRPNTPPPRRPDPRTEWWDFYEDFRYYNRDEERRRQAEREARYKEEERKKQEERKKKEREERTRYRPISEELKERERTWQYEFFNPVSNKFTNPMTGKQYNKMFQDEWFEVTGTKHYSDTAAYRAGANYGRATDNRYYGEAEDYERRRRERGFGDVDRKLKCKTCGKKVNTKFVGLETMFECNDCQWNAYQRKKEEPKSNKPLCHMTGKECKTPITCAADGCQFVNSRR